MRRVLLLVLVSLVGFTVAEGLRSLAVPNVFQSGMKMSAGTMNENLESLWARRVVVRESVVASRRVQVDLRNRVNALAPAAASLALSGLEGAVVSLQDDDVLPWPFKAGEVVDAGAVNASFDRFATDFGNFAEFNDLLVRDMEVIAARIGALEEALGLPSGARADAAFEPYVAAEINVFTKNQLIVTTEVNENFEGLDVVLAVLEGTAAELAVWLEHEVQRINAVEEVAGPPVLAESDYLLSVAGRLDWDDYSDRTKMAVLAYSDIFADGGWALRRYPGGDFDVSSAGDYDFTIDARRLAEDGLALAPEALADQYLTVRDETTQRRTLFISNPLAVLQAVSHIHVQQGDGFGSAWSSHRVEFFHYGGEGGSTYSVAGDRVFSDRPVTIAGTLVSTEHDFVYELDLSFGAGWNLVYSDYGSRQPNRNVHRSRLLAPDDASSYSLLSMQLAWGNADQVVGYSLFAAHEFDGEGEPRAFMSTSRASADRPLSAIGPRWLSHNIAELTLVPIDQVIPNASGVISTDYPDARFMLVHIYGYDRAAVDAGELGVFASSVSQIVATSPAGNTIWLIYTDQTSRIHVDITDTGGTGASFKTESGGLNLHLGWNHVESVPSGEGDGSYVLTPYTGDVPTLVVIQH